MKAGCTRPLAPRLGTRTTVRAEASYPGHLYLIVSLAAKRPTVSIYRLAEGGGGNFLHLPLVTVR